MKLQTTTPTAEPQSNAILTLHEIAGSEAITAINVSVFNVRVPRSLTAMGFPASEYKHRLAHMVQDR
jgi:hypothetical protein